MSASTNEAPASRLFFALWPDEWLRDQLIGYQQKIVQSGRVEPGARLHMTMAFLGDVPAEQQKELISMSDEIRAPSVSLALDRFGYFERPQILWAGPSETPQALLGLHDRLRTVVQACGLVPPKEPFRPHVTLARKAQAPTQTHLYPALRWNVREFYLVESVAAGQESRYCLLKKFPLLNPPADGAK